MLAYALNAGCIIDLGAFISSHTIILAPKAIGIVQITWSELTYIDLFCRWFHCMLSKRA